MDIDKFGQFVLFFAGHEFHKKMLKELGIGPERIMTTSTQGRIFKTDEFAFASDPRLKRVASANIYDMLCSFFGQPSRKHLGERKLFISRSKANRRQIINEDEVVAYLERMGYERVWLEDVGIREAAAMMAEAKAVIAPHGAGLANLVFCLPGTKVLELFCSQFTSDYWKLSSQKNLIYYAFEADGPDGEKLDSLALEKLKFRERQQDMTVSMNEFKDFINNQFERE